MADTKISALSAASAVAAANEFAINEAGTSKKVTGTLLKAFTNPRPIIAGASGAVTDVIGVTTLQILTANNADIPTTTVVTQLTATGLASGWWLAKYKIVWQSNVTSTGITWTIQHTGTAANMQTSRVDIVSSTTALATTGVSDQEPSTLVVGFLPSNWTRRANNVALGPNAGVRVINVNEVSEVEALFLVTGTGDLLLRANSEIASTITRVCAGTNASYTRLS